MFISEKRWGSCLCACLYVCEGRAIEGETLVIIRGRDDTSNGSLCDCQCGNRLSSTCPTWLPFAAEIHQPALHKSHGLHLVKGKDFFKCLLTKLKLIGTAN